MISEISYCDSPVSLECLEKHTLEILQYSMSCLKTASLNLKKNILNMEALDQSMWRCHTGSFCSATLHEVGKFSLLLSSPKEIRCQESDCNSGEISLWQCLISEGERGWAVKWASHLHGAFWSSQRLFCGPNPILSEVPAEPVLAVPAGH